MPADLSRLPHAYLDRTKYVMDVLFPELITLVHMRVLNLTEDQVRLGWVLFDHHSKLIPDSISGHRTANLGPRESNTKTAEPIYPGLAITDRGLFMIIIIFSWGKKKKLTGKNGSSTAAVGVHASVWLAGDTRM